MIFTAVLGIFLCGLPGSIAAQGRGLQFGSDISQEPPAKLDPRQPPSERDKDQLLAAAYFAHGRLLLQRDDQAGALQRYQRAYRCDPDAVSILREIVPLASGLKRHAVAARYAILSAEKGPMDPDLLRQLGELLVEQGDAERALKIYENAAAILSTRQSPDPALTLLKGEIGRLNLVLGKHDKAAEAFSVLAQAMENPEQFGFTREQKKQLLNESDRLYAFMAENSLRLQRFDDASALFRKVFEKRPNEAALGFQLARVAAEKKDWRLARQELDKYLNAKVTTAGVQAYELLAKILNGELGDEKKAQQAYLAELTRLQQADPKNLPLANTLAAQLLEAGEQDRAEKLYVDSLSREPAPAVFRPLAKIYREKKDAAALVALLGQAVQRGGSLEVFGPELSLLAKEGELYDRLVETVKAEPAKPDSRPTDATAKDAEKATTATPASGNPKDAAAYARLMGVGLLGIAVNRPAAVEELYEKALAQAQAPQLKIHETFGVGLLLADQHLLAAKVFERAIAAQPAKDKKSAYYFYLAGAYELGGNTAAAMAAAEKCAELGSDVAQFQSRPAWVLYHSKKIDEAEQRYLALLSKFDTRHDSDETRDQMRQARFLMSNICVMKNRIPEAEEWLEQVLDEFPEDVGAFNDLGYLWADQKKHLDRALKMCSRAVESEPENGAYRDSLGWAYYRLGRFVDAVRELELAAKITPDGVIFDHLGDAYLGMNERMKAIDAWKNAVDAFKKDPDPDKQKKTEDKIQQHQSIRN